MTRFIIYLLGIAALSSTPMKKYRIFKEDGLFKVEKRWYWLFWIPVIEKFVDSLGREFTQYVEFKDYVSAEKWIKDAVANGEPGILGETAAGEIQGAVAS